MVIPGTQFGSQKGQTLLIVAVALVGFVAMGAMAIDLTSLYAARSEIQRAANATALAGAKAFVDSGFTTDSTLSSRAKSLAQAYVAAAVGQNLVANAAPQLAGTQIDVTSKQAQGGNPTITVKLQQKNLPLFFAHIWGSNSATVSATAVAEAYNPGQTGSPPLTPSAPKCVKPILLPNLIPGSAKQGFVDPKTGKVAGSFVKFQLRDLSPACKLGRAGCQVSGTPAAKEYLPLQDSNTPNYLPACASSGSDFLKSVAGCDGVAFSSPQCGSSNNPEVFWSATINNVDSSVSSGLECVIHSSNGSVDALDQNAYSSGNGLLIDPGTFSQTQHGLAQTATTLTSDSIITVPLFDPKSFSPGSQQVEVVGFLTLFVDVVNPKQNGKFNATILNVTGTGCGSKSSGTPISGGGVSAVPVRLIQ